MNVFVIKMHSEQIKSPCDIGSFSRLIFDDLGAHSPPEKTLTDHQVQSIYPLVVLF
jgi:hypothetical protein